MYATYADAREAFLATGDLDDFFAMENLVTADQPLTEAERNEQLADSLGFKILCNSMAAILVMGALATIAALLFG